MVKKYIFRREEVVTDVLIYECDITEEEMELIEDEDDDVIDQLVDSGRLELVKTVQGDPDVTEGVVEIDEN
jgi:hypothetical protein